MLKINLKTTAWIVCVGFLAALHSCIKDPNPKPVTNALTIEFDKNDTPNVADGVTIKTVNLTVNSQLNATFKTINLECTGGKFLSALAATPTKIAVERGANNTATVRYQVGTKSDDFSIWGSISGSNSGGSPNDATYEDKVDFHLGPIIASKKVVISATTDGVAANGVDEMEVTITAKEFAGKKFELSVSSGTIRGVLKDNKLSGQLDAAGEAKAWVKTELFETNYRLVATLVDVTPNLVGVLDTTISQQDAKQLIDITPDPDSVKSVIPNGIRNIPVTIEVAKYGGKEVEIKTSHGIIEEANNKIYNTTLDPGGKTILHFQTELFRRDYTITVKLKEQDFSFAQPISLDNGLDPNNFVQITPTKVLDSIIPNGSDRIPITVKVPWYSGQPVTITTSKGTIVESNDKSHNQKLNAKNELNFNVVTDMFTTNYLITVALDGKNYSYPQEITLPTQLNPSDLLAITAAQADTKWANGQNTLKFTFDAHKSLAGKKLSLELKNGVFAKTVSDKKTDVTLNELGQAQIEVTTEWGKTSYPLEAIIEGTTYTFRSNHGAKLLDASQILTLITANATSLEANGSSEFTIKANIDPQYIKLDGEYLKFTLNNGWAVEGKPDSTYTAKVRNNEATIKARVTNNPGNLYISAEMVNNPNIRKNLTLSPALSYPQQVRIVPSTYSVDTTNLNVDVSVYLTRTSGTEQVSSGFVVSITQVEQMVNGSWILLNYGTKPVVVKSGSNGVAAFNFVPASNINPSATGMRVTVQVPDGPLTVKSETLTIGIRQ